jgi:hypothetical protein
MKEIVFVSEKLSCKFHALTASLDMDGNLVFDDGEVHPAVNGNDGCEVDDYLLVRAEHKSRVLNLLGQAFHGISDTCGQTADARLFCMIDRVARSGHWKLLDEIERWLMDRDVPFTKKKCIINSPCAVRRTQ